jgi:23S rRNA (uracil1939-C5)-methyltransferase
MADVTGGEAVLVAEKLVAGGAALAREPDGRVVLVTGALPGETVAVRYLTRKRDLATGVVSEVLDASPQRRVPPCPRVADGCGGCGWQHIAPDAQPGFKVAIVEEALTRTGRLIEPVVTAGATLPSEAVRTTVRMAVDADGRLGFRAARSHDVVPTEHCLVTHPLLDGLLPGLRLRGATEVGLRVGVASGERSAWWTPDDRVRPSGLAPDVATGALALVHEDVAGHRFQVSARSFFQSSPQGAASLVHAVRAAAGELAASATHALDAYAGVGLFAATVFGPSVRVTAVESSRAACADARVNVPGATIVESPMERWQPERADLVVADPARAGLDKAGVAAVRAATPERLVLVSCDPVSLARDARLLAAAGYRHAASEVLDLFPHTPHVEVVTRFDRA